MQIHDSAGGGWGPLILTDSEVIPAQPVYRPHFEQGRFSMCVTQWMPQWPVLVPVSATGLKGSSTETEENRRKHLQTIVVIWHCCNIWLRDHRTYVSYWTGYRLVWMLSHSCGTSCILVSTSVLSWWIQIL